MSDCVEPNWSVAVPEKASWPAVFSLTLGVFSLVTAEFLPASLLTPMAASLHISEALAGQAVTATALVALVAALLAAVVTRGLDRRLVLMGFSVLLILSNLLVAAAPNLILLLLARILLGIALGGFWSMATAVAIRLVPAPMVPRALSILFSGVSVATIVAVPLGSYLGGLYGWRSVFLFATLIGVVTLLCQMTFLPKLVSHHAARLETLVEVLLRPGMRLGVICSVLVFGGHFALFTYVRPFLETTAGIGANGIALMLLGFGVANFVGTMLAGVLLERSLRLTLTLAPLIIGAVGLGLAVLHLGLPAHAVLVALWGMAFGAVPVGWSTWTARSVPDETESAGGILVAAVQIAIAAGAALGGSVFSFSGVTGVFLAGGILLLLTACVVFARVNRSLPG
ncbi:MFS transporter [Acidisoma cellulosilytica]|uniref:MFS transporter n=1 Tax=Acidisoma cellulosilyticum TaxID=2802395 RepID=A0A963Z5G0_9PROT|nr:MFS transporter [Acidisoma cellulosilyticum]MCB8882173.1 MFS transporter [Acidisoma cellulosilyticum]